MNTSRDKLERLGTGLILMAALLTFISPLVTLRGPAGALRGDGIHAGNGLAQLRSALTAESTYQLSQGRVSPGRAVVDPAQTLTATAGEALNIPFSVKISWLAAWMIYLAIGCAGLALLDLVILGRAVAKLCLAGGCFAALTVVHVVVMGSDLQAWTTHLLNSGALNSNDGVFMTARLLVVNSFQIGPGLGLLALAACLFLASFISSTRAIERIRSVVRMEPRFAVSQPVRVRPLHPNYAEETCSSVDLSPGGLCLESNSDHYYIGMEVYVTRDFRGSDQSSPEEHGSIVRVQHLDDGRCRFAINILSHPAHDAATGLAARQDRRSQHPIEVVRKAE